MMKLVCGNNFLEYAGQGYFQCGRNVKCPKKENNKILGFDCILYIDNLPKGYGLTSSEIEQSKDIEDVDIVQINTSSTDQKEHPEISDDKQISDDKSSVHEPGKSLGDKLIRNEQIFLECK